MSVQAVPQWIRDRVSAERDLRQTFTTVLFGDRLGLAVFLGCLCLFALVWRTSILITDTYTIANGLYSLSNGHLTMTEAAYGSSLETPGAVTVDGEVFARNYGAIVLSLPYWVFLEALGTIVDLRIGIVALWSLTLLGFVVTVGRIIDDETTTVVGSLVVLCLFLANVAISRPLDADATHLYALQLFHLTVAAFGPVILYRLFSRLYTRRIGLASAMLFTFGTPLLLWATVPKRHVITATVVLAVAYCLFRSRTRRHQRHVHFRALAYALIGLYAWIHAAEALLFMFTLAMVDVPTARDNRFRTLLVVTFAVTLSLVPFFVTNVLITGSPIEPPRALLTAAPITDTGPTGSETATADPVAGGSGSTDTVGGGQSIVEVLGQLTSPVVETVTSLLVPLRWLGVMLAIGFDAIISQPVDFSHAVIRSGHTSATLDAGNEEAVNLSLLESAPVLIAVVGAITALKRIHTDPPRLSRVLPARTVVDLFAITTALGIVFMYGNRLPIHAQITVRYWFPLFPLGVYLVVRTPVVRRTLTEYWRTFAWVLTTSLFVGGQLLVVVVFLTANGIGEAFQFHALLALAIAGPLAVWVSVGRSDSWAGQIGAALLGIATAVPTLFAVLVAIDYYALGDTHALPMVRWLAEILSLL